MTLLLDALDRTLMEPQSAPRWQALMEIWRETRDETARVSVLSVLETLPDGDARADILRLTFLAKASGESRFEDAAAAQVLAAQPSDPDRMAAFMAHRWLSALQRLETRADFIAALSAGRMPEMARRLMQDAARLIPPDFLPRAPDAIQRAAIVIPYVGNQLHTPSVMALAQGALLAREGRQVHIFSAQELAPLDASLFRGDGSKLVLPPLDTRAMADILPAGMNITISDSRFSLSGRWRNLMPDLAGFDPDVVFLVGLYSPLAAALYTVRPLVGISANTVAPIAPLDVWLTAGPEEERREVWGGSFPAPQPVYHPYRVKRSNSQWRVTRAELGLSETDLIWVTAGFRLEHEIKGEWARKMLQLLSRYPQVVWILAGGEGEVPQALQQAAPHQVLALATRNDLPGVFRLCDIYVNPPRMGGGFSVAEAMAEGLPVTAFSDSDGGDKVGALAVPDTHAYMERLAALTENPGLRVQMGAVLRERFAERIDLEASGPALVAACRLAARLARTRFTRPF